MNPQRNLIQQVMGLRAVADCFKWGFRAMLAQDTLSAGICRVQNAIDDCVEAVAPAAFRYEIKEEVEGAAAYLERFEKVKRNLMRLNDEDIYFRFQAVRELNHTLAPLQRIFMDNNWGDIDHSCVLFAQPGCLYQSIDTQNNCVIYCTSPLDATIVFSIVEARMIEAALCRIDCEMLHPKVTSHLNLSEQFFEQDDTGKLVTPERLVSRWRSEAERGVHRGW